MRDHKKAVQNTKGERRNGEEIHRCDGFTMIVKKCLPALPVPDSSELSAPSEKHFASEISNPSFSNSP